ncbi:MBL fold metallo-hydrolase [Acinetobacter bereziniae]|uniref:MBL fold metallo-hydrolase n=1 Tax=Acinetobacter bereziniae TaxID=106648 RepID=UPI0021D14252|nr:MBL fold metallo-hydrolase [Acinetobacter bereziniae]MCU4316660.1 MBL fold metallo-hydrolase [Acinetobacter bereziniae]
MKIHHIRSATFVIESNNYFLLIDPMLSEKGELPAFSFFRFKAKRNPLVDLSANTPELLKKVTHCLITHSQTFNIRAFQHTDHLDKKGEVFLLKNEIPVYTFKNDVGYLEKIGLKVKLGLDNWQSCEFLGGKLTAIPARHGHGWISKIMANGCGFYLELPGEPSIYICGDTVLTDDVKKALLHFQPDITVVPAGQAQMDVGQPILMSKMEIKEIIKLSPKFIVANHLEALNHCPIKRADIKKLANELDSKNRIFVPNDGETLEFV